MHVRRTIAQHNIHQPLTLEAISALSRGRKDTPGDREEQGIGQDSQKGACSVGDENWRHELVFDVLSVNVDEITHIFDSTPQSASGRQNGKASVRT